MFSTADSHNQLKRLSINPQKKRGITLHDQEGRPSTRICLGT